MESPLRPYLQLPAYVTLRRYEPFKRQLPFSGARQGSGQKEGSYGERVEGDWLEQFVGWSNLWGWGMHGFRERIKGCIYWENKSSILLLIFVKLDSFSSKNILGKWFLNWTFTWRLLFSGYKLLFSASGLGSILAFGLWVVSKLSACVQFLVSKSFLVKWMLFREGATAAIVNTVLLLLHLKQGRILLNLM